MRHRAASRATSSASRCSWPTSTSTSCRELFDGSLLWSPAVRRWPGFAAPTTSATRTCRWARRSRELVERAHGHRARRADPPADAPALLRALLQPGQLLLLLRRRRRARASGRRPRHEHALGRAPRLRACRSTRAASTASTAVLRGRFAKALHVSPLMGMDHTYDWRLTEPGERLSVHIESAARRRRARVRRHALAARREIDARAAAPRARALPAR